MPPIPIWPNLPKEHSSKFNFTKPTTRVDQPITTIFLDLFEKQTLFQSNIKRNKRIFVQGLVTEAQRKEKK